MKMTDHFPVLAVLLAVLLAVSLAASTLARAADDDHERARHALREGTARPLSELMGVVKRYLDGDVVGVEFDRENGRNIYEFRVITPDGSLHEVHVDALSGKILGHEGD